MADLKEIRLDILLFLTILFSIILIIKGAISLQDYLKNGKDFSESDERFMQRAYLDDTTTDIEKYLKNKEDEESKNQPPTPEGSPEPSKRKLNFGMISNFLKK